MTSETTHEMHEKKIAGPFEGGVVRRGEIRRDAQLDRKSFKKRESNAYVSTAKARRFSSPLPPMLPEPRTGESDESYIARCVPVRKAWNARRRMRKLESAR
jgi:hypothetical protein